MSTAAFAYILLLCGIKADDLTALLPEDRRAQVQADLEKVKDLPPNDIRARLKKLRDDQLVRQRETASERFGLEPDHVAPKLYSWLTRSF
jgi:hypothetical protein